MTYHRPSRERGYFNRDWLESWHSFSFGEYRDPKHRGFSVLRVINEDIVAPGGGFPTHPHEHMEIITYVMEGALEHQDSTGGGGVIRPGDVQRMSAGTGIQHSEFNHSSTERVHLLQIWLFPDSKEVAPGYDQKHFPLEKRRNQLQLVVSPDGRDNSLSMHQDAYLYASVLEGGKSLTYQGDIGRAGWVQMVRGTLDVNGTALQAGDGFGIGDIAELTLKASEEAEFLLFDLP